MPRTIGLALTTGFVTLSDLHTTLSLEDVHDVLEVAKVNNRNDAARQRHAEKHR